MKAIDTNVVVRFLTLDDEPQAIAATKCIQAGIFVPHGVLMEAEWVLRRGYGWTAERINSELNDFIAMRCVEVDHVEGLQWALDRHRDGADWADMLHLIASRGHSAFSTFDAAIAKRVGEDAPLPIELLQ